MRSTGSVTGFNWRITKSLPSGNPTISDARIIYNYANNVSGAYLTDVGVGPGAVASDIVVAFNFPTPIPSGTTFYAWVELQEHF